MEAGREMDALVAEKVMGWKRVPHAHPEIEAAGGMWLTPRGPRMCPAYSTDIAAAWGVVEWFTRRSYTVALHTTHSDGWVCSIRGALLADTAQAPTAPLAICRAALAAVGVRDAP